MSTAPADGSHPEASGPAASDGESAPRPMRKDALRNRQLLIAAAREVFAERGLEASLDDIARRAGLGVGTAYRHFANKHELARAIFAEAIDEVVDLAERSADADDALDGLTGFVEGAVGMQAQDRGLREVLMGVNDPDQLEEINERISKPLGRLTERAQSSGVLRPGVESTDIGIVVTMLCTVADLTGDVAPDLWRRYLPMLMDGLRGGTDLPVGPIGEPELRQAMTEHKRRLITAAQPD